MGVDRIVLSATHRDFHAVLPALARRRWALWLLVATGCSGSSLKVAGKDSSVESRPATSSGGVSGQGGDGDAADANDEDGAERITGSGGSTAFSGNSASGGLSDSGGSTRISGVIGFGGIGGTGGAVRTGGAPGSGGIGGMGGTAGSGGILGMPCTAKQDCPSSATCCDGSDPSCDGTRLPSGDSANPGEFVVSADGVTVTDTITGLVWQRDGSGTRAVCTTDSSNLRCLWAEAEAYCASLVLGGLSGWRLPGWMELLTIVDPTMDATSTINQTAFPNTVTDPYWTSSLFGVFQTKLYISFSDSTVGYCNDTIRRVRCVRGSRCYPTARFSVLDGGLVRDTLTGLVWQQQGSATAMNWADAKNYCSSLVSGGPGFRLPTLKELDSLVDPTVASGATLDKTAFPSTGTKLYWTSSPLGPDLSEDQS